MKKYVQRENGAIVGEFSNPQPGFAEEEIDEKSAELRAFRSTLRRGGAAAEPEELNQSGRKSTRRKS